MNVRSLLAVVFVVDVAVFGNCLKATAADDPRVLASIRKAAGWLETQIGDEQDEGVRSLAALALLLAEVPQNRPALAGPIQEVVGRVKNGEYQPGPHHVYQAGVEATLLADVDVEKYRPQIQAIANYIIGQQLPNGGWDYPTGRQGHGDTSVVQYACLGLWAGKRAGLEIPQSTWDQAIMWHVNTQNSDGGSSYVPGTESGNEHGGSSINLTLAALCSTMIAARFSFPGRADSLEQLLGLKAQRSQTESKTDFGPLQAVDLGAVQQPDASPASQKTTVDIEVLKRFVQRAMAFVSTRIGPTKGDLHYPVYYYYTMERMAALADIQQIGQFNWFDRCSDYLISIQSSDGHWQINNQFAVRDTSFVTLFLTRSTARVLGRTIPVPLYGGGLMKGGRGLTGDLSTLKIDSEGLVVQAKDLGPLDQMLASLSNLGDANIDDVQRQIVEKVQIGDREALIQNKQRLLQLVNYQNPDDPDHAAEVRRTAIWAIGRTNDLSLVTYLIKALDDVNFSVMLEARNALCWLARRPNGLGEANDPLEDLPADASADDRQAAIADWHARAFRNWGNWYLQNRPYEDRGDEFEAWLLDRMSSL